MNDASVVKTVVDICSRSFMILSDEGDVQAVSYTHLRAHET